MSNLYEILSKLCESKGVSGYRMCKDLGIQPSVMTDLKMGRRSSVKAETAAKNADYFNVSVSYLLGKEDNEKKLVVNDNNKLDNVYFNFAKDAQDSGIDPKDIKLAIETIKKLRGK